MVPKLNLQKFSGTNNLDVFFLESKNKQKVELTFGKFSRLIFNVLRENPDLLKIIFVFDNLNKKIWLWYSEQNQILKQRFKFFKLRGDCKILNKIISTKNQKKTRKLINSFLGNKLGANFEDYVTEKVSGIDQSNNFEELFEYNVVNVNLYKIHYKKSEYVNIYGNNDTSEEKITVKKCKNCGWIMKENRKFCPKCKNKYE
jgi:hypothetical protein